MPPSPMPPSPMLRLTWYDPNTQAQVELVEALPITIGRADSESTIKLNSRVISGEHARLEADGDQIILRDLKSKNGTVIDGQRIDSAPIAHGGSFSIGPFVFTVFRMQTDAERPRTMTFDLQPPSADESRTNILTPNGDPQPPRPAPQPIRHRQPPPTAAPQPAPQENFLTFDSLTGILVPPSSPEAREVRREAFPPAWFTQAETINPEDLSRHQPEQTTYLAIGGGLGSFTWVDHLMVYGADPRQIVSIGFEPKPYGRYRRLCRNSQIPEHERLRSNSDSTPDNVWGWPGYAVREAYHATRKGDFRAAFNASWKIFNEPFVETYTPISGNVFDSIDREAERIGWDRIWRHGRVRAIRKTTDGRYAVAYSFIQKNRPSIHRYIIADYLHVAVGYPGIRLLPDLQKYRQASGDFQHVVNAYEQHEHVYEDLKKNGGIVLLRGRGIVASRIVQRIFELRRDHNAKVGILHLMRTPLAEGARYGKAQRVIDNHWEFQPFNWPKAAWSGDLRIVLEDSDDATRDRLLDEWGGTTTADRIDWRDMVRQGLREGWYEIQFGNVAQVVGQPDGKLATVVQSSATVERRTELCSDYIIDATGLDSDIRANALLEDLVDHYRLPLNPKRRLAISNEFELTALRNGNGRAYAAGVSTLGGPYAAVDSFLGLQYAALRSVDDLVRNNAPGIRKLNGLRSFSQWVRWAQGKQP